MSRRNSALVTVLAGLLAVGLAGCGGASADAASQTVLRVPVGDSPVQGPADAWVTVIEFSDFECPYCINVQPTLSQILPEYGSQVRHVFKHFPLPMHALAVPAAVGAECAREQGRFWEFHDLAFASARAGTLFGGSFETEMVAIAAQSGVDVASWETCVAAPAGMQGRITADLSAGTLVGIRATPSFVINGSLLLGAQPAAAFRSALDEALAKAKASGVPAADYYDKVILGR